MYASRSFQNHAVTVALLLRFDLQHVRATAVPSNRRSGVFGWDVAAELDEQ
jgi:hypothetical protein